MPRRRPRPERPNRYEHLARPTAEFDFHDRGVLVGSEVRRMLLGFLADAASAGHERVRVITGKGLHSNGRPLVREQVRRTLREEYAAGRIRGYTIERVTAGGDGALIVDL
jgi:DNA-nicking Smr family endonuclease